MKYVLLFVETEQFNSDMAAMSPSERERAYDRVNEWFANHCGQAAGRKQAEIIGHGDDGATRPW